MFFSYKTKPDISDITLTEPEEHTSEDNEIKKIEDNSIWNLDEIDDGKLDDILIISVDDVPIKYTTDYTSAKKYMRQIADRISFQHIGNYRTYIEEEDYSITITGIPKFSIMSYYKTLNTIKIDIIQSIEEN